MRQFKKTQTVTLDEKHRLFKISSNGGDVWIIKKYKNITKVKELEQYITEDYSKKGSLHKIYLYEGKTRILFNNDCLKYVNKKYNEEDLIPLIITFKNR